MWRQSLCKAEAERGGGTLETQSRGPGPRENEEEKKGKKREKKKQKKRRKKEGRKEA